MFVFQYSGLRDRLSFGENSYNTKLINAKGGLNSIIKASQNYIGQDVVVIFDNTKKDFLREKFPIGIDFVNSTFRYGVLKDVTKPKRAQDSLVLFEDPVDGKKLLTPIQTIMLIDIVSAYDLSYPIQVEDPELSKFFFQLNYYRRGEAGLVHSNPLGAFVDGRSKLIRPGNECKQAYFKGFQSMSQKLVYGEESLETCTAAYEKKFREGTLPSQKTYVIRCGVRKK